MLVDSQHRRLLLYIKFRDRTINCQLIVNKELWHYILSKVKTLKMHIPFTFHFVTFLVPLLLYEKKRDYRKLISSLDKRYFDHIMKIRYKCLKSLSHLILLLLNMNEKNTWIEIPITHAPVFYHKDHKDYAFYFLFFVNIYVRIRISLYILTFKYYLIYLFVTLLLWFNIQYRITA